MAETTTVIFLVASLLMAATVVSGEGPPSPTDCVASLSVCLPALTQGGKPSSECCSALETAVKTQLPCLCGFIRSPMLMVPFNVTDFNALFSQTCKLDTDSNLCSETAAQPPLPTAQPPLPTGTTPNPGPPKADKDAASKVVGSGLVGIFMITISMIFY